MNKFDQPTRPHRRNEQACGYGYWREALMAKRILFIAFWTVLFYLLGRFLVGMIIGVSPNSIQTDELIGTTIYFELVTVPKLVAVVGLLLGIFGFLPGTSTPNQK